MMTPTYNRLNDMEKYSAYISQYQYDAIVRVCIELQKLTREKLGCTRPCCRPRPKTRAKK